MSDVKLSANPEKMLTYSIAIKDVLALRVDEKDAVILRLASLIPNEFIDIVDEVNGKPKHSTNVFIDPSHDVIGLITYAELHRNGELDKYPQIQSVGVRGRHVALPDFMKIHSAYFNILDQRPNKVSAIKRCRELLGLGLKEAKDLVEDIIDSGAFDEPYSRSKRKLPTYDSASN